MTVLWANGVAAQTPEGAGMRVSSEYGMRTHPVTGVPETFHYGIDLVGWSIIIAPVSGIVSFAGYNGGAGNEVRIKADNGDVFRLLHNRELWVKTGQRVTQGQQVAVMGTTGSSTGVHCHEETRPGGGNAINPRDYYARANGGSAAGGGGTPISKEWDEMASKQEIKDAMFEVLASRPDAVLIHYSGAGRNGIYLVAPGYWHQFTAEQWKQFQDHGMRSAIRELVPVNVRDVAVFKEIYTLNQGVTASITDAQLATITKSVQDSLKNLSVDADVDDETITKIANAAVDRLAARAAN